MCKESKTTLIALAIAAILLVSGCATATAEEPPTAKYGAFMTVNDVDEPAGAVRIVQEMEARQAAEAEAAAAVEEVDEGEWYEEEYYEPTYYEESYAPAYSGDGFASEGVREHDGRTETYYSSNVARHYRTGEWEVDDEGYYRDADGYYVVAASDVAEGETLETSKGTARVYDSGCDEGVTDFYTAF